MAEHEQLTQRLALQIFFADPYSPWQRGTNEKTKGCCVNSCRRAPTCRGIRNVS